MGLGLGFIYEIADKSPQQQFEGNLIFTRISEKMGRLSRHPLLQSSNKEMCVHITRKECEWTIPDHLVGSTLHH
jgi:hypothetical protein